MRFRHERIDSDPPGVKLGFCLTTDLTGNGRDDVIIGSRGRSYKGRRLVKQIENSSIPTFDDVRHRFGLAEVNLFWYENPGWKRHKMSSVSRLDVGASLGDINGNGRMDVIAGQGIHNNDVYWFEQPKDPRTEWQEHLVTDDFEKYHDLAVGDVDDDGQSELVGLSQESEVLFYYDIPDDPYESPWPAENRHIVADGLNTEGVQIVDIDGDGQTEIIAGTSIFHQPTEPDQSWQREDITTVLDDVRVAVADLDQDGELEVVFSEGDLPEYGSHLGRVAWFDPPDWEPTFLREDLFGPHSLQIADFTGDGRQDVYVGEMALESNDDPKHFIFVNQGGGEFEEHVIDHGIPTHEAKVTDLTGNGRPDIVGKSYGPDHHVDAWYNEG
ncbi:FG-GAP repeat domain-containing protein [Halalkalicoccus salilacus]|uniref:FG-GAP repeat domain-containing protein n=2 Tax=Halalkalicoccus TaxID=332246 RepID=UPI002F961C93